MGLVNIVVEEDDIAEMGKLKGNIIEEVVWMVGNFFDLSYELFMDNYKLLSFYLIILRYVFIFHVRVNSFEFVFQDGILFIVIFYFRFLEFCLSFYIFIFNYMLNS